MSGTAAARLAAVVLAAALGAAGCSGDEGGPAGPGSATTSTDGPRSPASGAAGTAAPTTAPAPSTPAPSTSSGSSTSAGSSDGGDGGGDAPSAPATRPVGEPTAAVSSLPPVAADEDVELSDGLVVAVTDVREQQVAATEPGDISGSAAVVAVRARNDADEPFDLSQLVVTAVLDGGAPASPTRSGPADPLSGALAPGASSTGTYAFRLDGGGVEGISLQVSSGSSSTVAVVQP